MTKDHISWSMSLRPRGEAAIETRVYSIPGQQIVAELDAQDPIWIEETMYSKVPDEGQSGSGTTRVATWREGSGLEVLDVSSEAGGQFMAVAGHLALTEAAGASTDSVVVADRTGESLLRWDLPARSGGLRHTREMVLWSSSAGGSRDVDHLWSYNVRTHALRRCEEPAGLELVGEGEGWLLFSRGEPAANAFELYRV